MSKTDFTDLDGKVLRTFLTILEENSVSKAADRLGVTQSAISHTLAKLRQVLGDPLFVRSGQGLTPTERALSLKEPVQRVLDGMRALTDDRPFDPLSEEISIQIATNDMPRELIFPPLLRALRAEGVRLRLGFIPSGVPDPDLLRSDRCQLMLTPLPPDGPDIFQKRVLISPLMVFYDAARRSPAGQLAELLCNRTCRGALCRRAQFPRSDAWRGSEQDPTTNRHPSAFQRDTVLREGQRPDLDRHIADETWSLGRAGLRTPAVRLRPGFDLHGLASTLDQRSGPSLVA